MAHFAELSFQMIDLVAEPFLFALELVTLPSQRLALSTQRLALAFRVFGTLAPVELCRSAIRLARLRRLRHAAVMPEFADRYKPLINHAPFYSHRRIWRL